MAIPQTAARQTMNPVYIQRRWACFLLMVLALCAQSSHVQAQLQPLPPPLTDMYGTQQGSIASDQAIMVDDDWYREGGWFSGNFFLGREMAINESPELPWGWQILPDGLVWRSYLAGVKEPRLSVVTSNSTKFNAVWDAVLGGRVALLRYGTPNAYRPEGWELQIEGAALPRIWPNKFSAPLIATDYRVGLPLVYAEGQWQFKTGYYHISSHLGDEFMLLYPDVERINYMRDALMLGVGYYWTDNVRLFAEADWAFGADGGAKPWEFQFGVDYSPAIRGGAPFAAVYGNLRQELNYGGFFVAQAGWQWRGGPSMKTFRVGFEYINGKSQQFEFYDQFEQQTGFGIWFDY